MTEETFLTLFGVPLGILVLAVISYFMVGKEDREENPLDDKEIS